MKDLNTIKKGLYKNKPIATFKMIRSGVAYYTATLEGEKINFEIPVSDMQSTDFLFREDAKFLIRWIVL